MLKHALTGTLAAAAMLMALILSFDTARAQEAAAPRAIAPAPDADAPLIQIAILLDTSNSMDGLIDQTKTQLWSIVNQFATARQNGRRPRLEVALFEYGNDRIPAAENHIRLVVPLTGDLDRISEELFALRTNGGQEYCGAVIDRATVLLNWSKSTSDYKAIFIAGNEPFTQGPVDYREAVKAAVTRGIVVNTIHCGDEQAGIRGQWEDGAKRGDGAYSFIDQNRRAVHIATPMDDELARLNTELNSTYVAYGPRGTEGAGRQTAQDANAAAAAPAAMAERVAVKAGALYDNAGWDLVDASRADKDVVNKLDEENLPQNMREMTADQRQAYVEQQAQRRREIQGRIAELVQQREAHLAEQRKQQADQPADTLGRVMLDAARRQAEARQFQFETSAN